MYFKIFDRDCDGILNVGELQAFLYFYIPTLKNIEFYRIKMRYKIGYPQNVTKEMLPEYI